MVIFDGEGVFQSEIEWSCFDWMSNELVWQGFGRKSSNLQYLQNIEEAPRCCIAYRCSKLHPLPQMLQLSASEFSTVELAASPKDRRGIMLLYRLPLLKVPCFATNGATVCVRVFDRPVRFISRRLFTIAFTAVTCESPSQNLPELTILSSQTLNS